MDAQVGSTKMSAVSHASTTPKGLVRRVRSQVTNGKRTFVQGDGRSPWARRWRDLIEAHARDLSPNGIEHLSEAQRSLIKRAATIEIQLEAVEGQLSEGKEANLSAYAAASGHLKRILEYLGDRRARDVSPTLSDFLRGDRG
jgi:hypothetical protein